MDGTREINEEWSVPLPDRHEYMTLNNETLSIIQQNDPHVQSLCVAITRNELDWVDIGHAIGNSHVLKHLSVTVTDIVLMTNDADVRRLMLRFFCEVSRNRSIHTLKLNFQMSNIMGEAFGEMVSFFENNANLVRLDSTSFMPSLQNDGFVKALSANTSLKHINIYGVKATSDMVEAICTRPNLNHLILEEEFESGSCKVINKLLTEQCSSLDVLELNGMLMAISDHSNLITNGLAANKSLKSLTLRSQSALRGYRPVSSLFKTLRLTQLKDSLHTLQLGGTRNDVDWGNAINVLRGLTALKTLVLDRTEIEKNEFVIWGAIFNAVLGPSSRLEKLIARQTSMKLDSLRNLVNCLSKNTSLRVLNLSGSRDLTDDPFPSSFNTIWPSLFNIVRSSGCPLQELNIKDIWLCPENNAELATFLRRPDNTLKTFIGNYCFGPLPEAVPLSRMEKVGFRSVASSFAENLLEATSINFVSLAIGEVAIDELQLLVNFLSSPNCSLVEFDTVLQNGRRRYSNITVGDDSIIQLATDLAAGLRSNVILKKLHIGTKEALRTSATAPLRGIFTNLLNDPSSFEATMNSNHVLENLRFGSIINDTADTFWAVQVNKIPDKREVIRRKIMRNNDTFNVETLNINVLPDLMSFIGKYSGLKNMHSVVLQIKDLLYSVDNSAVHTGKRKRV